MIDAKEYKCDACGGTFTAGWSDEEAKDEYKEKFGMEVSDGDGIVCDDCYKQMMGEIDKGMPSDYMRKIVECSWEIGAAGFKVYTNDEGIIVTEVLSKDEVLDWLEKMNSGESLPDNITISQLSNYKP